MLTLRTLADLLEAGAELPTIYETTDDPEGSPYWIVYSEPPPTQDRLAVDLGRLAERMEDPTIALDDMVATARLGVQPFLSTHKGRPEDVVGTVVKAVVEGGVGSVVIDLVPPGFNAIPGGVAAWDGELTSVKVGQWLVWRRTPKSKGIPCRVKAVLDDGACLYVESFNGLEWQQWTAELSELSPDAAPTWPCLVCGNGVPKFEEELLCKPCWVKGWAARCRA